MNRQVFSFILGALFIFVFVLIMNQALGQTSNWMLFKTENSGFRFKNFSIVRDTNLSVDSNQNSNLMLKSPLGKFTNMFFYAGGQPKWLISKTPTDNLSVYRYDDNGNSIPSVIINRTSGDIFLSGNVSIPNGTNWTKLRGAVWQDAINRTDLPIGRWDCVKVPVDKCENSGCRLKIKVTNNNTNEIYAYSGIIEANKTFAVFNEGADQERMRRWNLTDFRFNTEWKATYAWLGDCQLDGSGQGCSPFGEYNKIYMCGPTGFTTTGMLIQYSENY